MQQILDNRDTTKANKNAARDFMSVNCRRSYVVALKKKSRTIAVRQTSVSRYHGAQLRTPLEHPTHQIYHYEGFMGAFNCSPIMPTVARFSDS